jgi:hypothetical protein
MRSTTLGRSQGGGPTHLPTRRSSHDSRVVLRAIASRGAVSARPDAPDAAESTMLLEQLIEALRSLSQPANQQDVVRELLLKHPADAVCATLQAGLAAPRAKVRGVVGMMTARRLPAHGGCRGGAGAHLTLAPSARSRSRRPPAQALVRAVLSATRPSPGAHGSEAAKCQQLRSEVAVGLVTWLQGAARAQAGGGAPAPTKPAPSPRPGMLRCCQACLMTRRPWCTTSCSS